MARLQLSESQSYLSMQLDCETYIRNLKSKHAHAYFFTKLAEVYFLLRFPQPYEGCACLRLEPLRACAIIPRLRGCSLNRSLASDCGPVEMVTAKPCVIHVLNIVVHVSIIPNHTQKTCSSFVLKSLWLCLKKHGSYRGCTKKFKDFLRTFQGLTRYFQGLSFAAGTSLCRP